MCECNLINDISADKSNNNKSATIKQRSFLGRRFPSTQSQNQRGGSVYDQNHARAKTRNGQIPLKDD